MNSEVFDLTKGKNTVGVRPSTSNQTDFTEVMSNFGWDQWCCNDEE